jgi:hypothetical protein
MGEEGVHIRCHGSTVCIDDQVLPVIVHKLVVMLADEFSCFVC